MVPLPPAYHSWLHDDQAPPLMFRAAPWLGAIRALVGRMRQLRQDLVTEGAGWEQFQAWLNCRNDVDALFSWGEVIGPRTGRTGEYVAVEPRAQASFHRLRRSSSRHPVLHVLRGWLRRVKDPLDPQQRRLVQSEIDDWVAARESAPKTPVERLAKGFLRREAAYTARCASAPLSLTRRQAMQLPKVIRQQLRHNAKAAGLPGWRVPAHSDEASDCLMYVDDTAFREQLWRQQQTNSINDEAIVRLLVERQREARQAGFRTTASYVSHQTAVRRPRKVLEWLRASSAHAAVTTRQLAVPAPDASATPATPWDAPFLRQKLIPYNEPAMAFPLVSTLEKVVVQMLAVGGWTTLHHQCHHAGAERLWQFRGVHADGREVDLWIAPFDPIQPSGTPVSYAGQASAVRACVQSNGTRSPHVMVVTMAVAQGATHLNHLYLETLVHELGHVLHYLAIDPNAGTGAECFPEDTVEFPSQLLAQVTYDPFWLASLAEGRQARRVSTWKAYLASSAARDSYVWLRKMVRSEIDLVAHLSPRPENISFLDGVRQIFARHGLDQHPDDRTGYGMFCTDAYAGLEYSYPLSMAVAEHFVPTRDDGSVDAGRLMGKFGELCEGLLREGYTTAKFRRAWKKTMGEPIEVSVETGFKAWSRRCL